MSTKTIESRSPQDPSEIVVSAGAADRDAVGAVFARAREAQREWARNALARADALSAAAAAVDAAKDEIVDLMVREVGKPLTEAVGEHGRSVRILRYQAQSALDPDGDTLPAAPPSDPRTLLFARRRPRGVAGLITPWNFPFAIPLWKAAPALAYGNAVVLKPASDALACGLKLEEILSAHLPEGIFTVVAGGGETGQAVIELADVVSFTGSTAVGLDVAAAATARGIASQAEMGGLNASIVLDDADVEAAAKVIAGAAMGYAGQKCTATGRVIVLGDPAQFTDALAAAVQALPTGDPADADTVVGPVINPPALEEVLAAARDVRSDGGRVVTGGERLDGPGLFVSPTVVDGQAPDARLAQEEVFGPIVTVLRADSAEQAVAISNSVAYGLVTSVFTGDLNRALTVIEGLETGMIRVNMPTSGVDFHAPFGGEKQSSFGPREQGKNARELYTSTHTITVGPAAGLSMALWRIRTAAGERLARGPVAGGPVELLAEPSLDALLAAGTLDGEGDGPVPAGSVILAPVAGQEVWAAGVTYSASRSARNEESGGHDFYDLVYDAERPELFFKAAPGRVRGPGAAIGVRADSGWDVPEPELALVVGAAGEILGYTIGNDVSSRSIEGENPLYLPQAKVYRGSCALGPCIVPVAEAPELDGLEITLTISRDGAAVFEGATQAALLRRRPAELVEWLFKAQDFPAGVVLLTGTSVIPAVEFTLRGGDEVRIAITGLGELVNPVEVVGT